jgi:vancomycin resistance protein YoaR
MAAHAPRRSGSPNLLVQILLTLLAGSFFFLLFIFLSSVLYQAWYRDRIFPGVSMLGVDLGGLTPAEAEQVINISFPYPRNGSVKLVYQDKSWEYTPEKLGLSLDPKTSAENAFAIGREGSYFHKLNEQLSTARSGRLIAPTYIFDQRLTANVLGEIATQVNHSLIEANIDIKGVDVKIRSGETGREMDQTATLEKMRALMETMMSGSIDLVVKTTEPAVVDVEKTGAIVKSVLSAPFALTMPAAEGDQPGPWSIDPETLSGMLTLNRVTQSGHSVYQVELNNQLLFPYLNNLGNKTNLLARNARFTFNDQTRKLDLIQPAVIGRTLNVSSTIGAIQQKIAAGQHDVTLAFDYQNPDVKDDATTDSLSIKELVRAETTYFYGSSAERVQNIVAAAARFHGLLVAPGETFSMAKGLGDISLDNGFAEAWIIYGGKTIKGVGGGVCQVSTTLFRTAFFAGFPIVERHPHAYRVGYYEKVSGNHIDPLLAGMDATVYVPVVDFRFTNDTRYWLLMETYVNPEKSSITWKFYSTKDGREVKADFSGPTNIVDAPEPLYKENTELKKGEIQQIEWEAAGADVDIKRTVTRNGEPYLTDEFNTHYEPWQAVFEYGPGTEGIPTPSVEEETPTPTP